MHALGIYLPLITVNCSILGGSLFMVERSLLVSARAQWCSACRSGFGWALAIIALASIREKILQYSNVPPSVARPRHHHCC